MNKTISLAAIGMVAVVMGLSAFAPAMADKPAEVLLCHFDNDGSVSLITVNENAVQAHVGNAHHVHENDEGDDFLIDEDVEGQTSGDCPVQLAPVD